MYAGREVSHARRGRVLTNWLWSQRLGTYCTALNRLALLCLLCACRLGVLAADMGVQGVGITGVQAQTYSEAVSCNSATCGLKLNFTMVDVIILQGTEYVFTVPSDSTETYRLTLEVAGKPYSWHQDLRVYINGFEVSYDSIPCDQVGGFCSTFYYCSEFVDITQYVIGNSTGDWDGDGAHIEIDIEGDSLVQVRVEQEARLRHECGRRCLFKDWEPLGGTRISPSAMRPALVTRWG
mmetsp:Transcript_5302/g.19387  ORF Transcript_5302/g.19387 Transcript_5302/m.19387 type:complete len:237 (-) Transcript_5302:906-1616(-)